MNLPNPTTPTNGQPGDATPILQNELALAQAITNFDGSQIIAGSVAEAALNNAINPRLRASEFMANFVYTGCLWSQVNLLTATMTGGTAYISGYRVVVGGVGSNTFAINSDTYVDIDNLGNVTYHAVSSNAASPSLATNSIRVAIVVTNGSTITFINTGQTDTSLGGFAPTINSVSVTVADSLGNLIYPTDPAGTVIGYSQIITPFTTTNFNTVGDDVPGLFMTINVPLNRKIRLVAYTSNLFTTAGLGTNVQFDIYESTNSVQNGIYYTGGSLFGVTLNPTVLLRPSAGVHTYHVLIYQSNSGTLTCDGKAAAPAYISAELR